jgi:trimethylamine--corrinoid protein Co-methyltransferase
MRANHIAQRTPGMRVLSDSQLQQVHWAALEILRDVGGRVFEDEALELLRDVGCFVSDGNLVRFPAALVEDAIASAPSRIVLCSRSGEPALWLEGNRTYFGTGSDLPNIIDLDTGERRACRLSDVEEMARVADALPNIDFVMSMALPADVPPAVSDRYAYRAMVTNTTKPIVYTGWDVEGVRDIVAMSESIAGSGEELARSPTMLAYLEPSSPLKHSKDALQKLLLLSSKGLPFVYAPGAISGGTAPMTTAGALVQCTAEVLTGLVLSQLKKRGTPFLWGSSAAPLNMRTMVNAYTSPDDMLHNCAMAELAHRVYDLPVWGFAGCSDSKRPDMQAAAEGTLWIATAALAGNNLVHDCGYLDSGLTGSFEMLLLVDEVIGLFKHFMQGIALTPETMALESIKAVGPDGHYLDSDLTVRHFRETWAPRWFDHQNFDNWQASGALACEERLRRAARAILVEHEVEPLPSQILDKMDAILGSARLRLA